jgi:transcriptional regulator of acetoin/glycerol metabolism
LVVRYSGQPPAIGDLRSVIAAVNIVLRCGKLQRSGGSSPSSDSSIPKTPAVTDAITIADFLLAEGKQTDLTTGGGIPDIDLESVAALELAAARDSFEEWMVKRALAASDGKQSQAAQRLGLSRAGLFKKMRKMGL